MSKRRFDYFPSSKLLVLRMALTVHEIFTRRLNWRITEELRLLSQGSGSTADFAKSIIDVGSSMTRPRDPEFGPHHPDISFRPLKSPSPTVIIEIAHSQKKKRLRALADEYILGSNLGIQVVVGVDIEYKKSKRATFSVWKAGVEGPDNDSVWFAETVVENEVMLAKPLAFRKLISRRYSDKMTASRELTKMPDCVFISKTLQIRKHANTLKISTQTFSYLVASYISTLKRRKFSRRSTKHLSRSGIQDKRSAAEVQHLEDNLTIGTRNASSETKNVSPSFRMPTTLPMKEAPHDAPRQLRYERERSHDTTRLSVRGRSIGPRLESSFEGKPSTASPSNSYQWAATVVHH